MKLIRTFIAISALVGSQSFAAKPLLGKTFAETILKLNADQPSK